MHELYLDSSDAYPTGFPCVERKLDPVQRVKETGREVPSSAFDPGVI